jgi:hypothetical protein
MVASTSKYRYLIHSLLLIVGLSYLVSSCTSQEGAWEDNIKLSQKEATFSAASDSLTFITNGDASWWISNIRLNETTVAFNLIKTTIDTFQIIENDFSIIKKSKTELQITMGPNPTDEQRTLSVGLQAGNYFDRITISQNGM